MAPNTTTALLSRFAPLLIKMVTLSTAPAAESQLYPTPTGKTQINDQNALGAVAGKSIQSCVSGDICLETTMTWWELEKGEKCTSPVSNKSCAEQGYTYRMDFIKPECNRNPIKGVPECLNAILLHKAKGPAGERLDPCCATYLLGDWMRVVYAPFGLSLWMNSKPPWMAPNTTTALLSRFAPLLIKMVTLSTAPAA